MPGDPLSVEPIGCHQTDSCARFVCGLRSTNTQNPLLSKEGLTVQCVLELAQGMEAA